MRRSRLVASTLCALAACGSRTPPAERPAAGGEPAALSPDTPVARIGKDVITLGDVDAEIVGQIRRIRLESEKQVYQTRSSALDGLIAERIFGAKAKAEGQTVQDYIKAEVEKGVAQPTEEEARKFYGENQQRMGGASFDEIKPRIVEYLANTQKQAAADRLVNEARAAAGVVVLLEEPQEPRVEVAAVGPSRGPANALVTIVEFSDFQ